MVLDELKDNDESHEIDGLTYLVDKDLGKRAGDIKVDFIDNGWQQGFNLSSSNPLSSEPSTCGSSCSC